MWDCFNCEPSVTVTMNGLIPDSGSHATGFPVVNLSLRTIPPHFFFVSFSLMVTLSGSMVFVSLWVKNSRRYCEYSLEKCRTSLKFCIAIFVLLFSTKKAGLVKCRSLQRYEQTACQAFPFLLIRPADPNAVTPW